MMAVAKKALLLATIVCATLSGLLSAQQTTTEDPGTGEVSLSRYCDFAIRSRQGTGINCLIDSNDPDSVVYWSLVSPDGQVVDLGHCTGMRDTCTSPLSPDVKLSRWYSWSTVTFKNIAERSGSRLVCSASHLGRNNSDSCPLAFSATTTTTTTTTERPRTGEVSLRRYCDLPGLTNGGNRFTCHIDSNDPDSVVYWSLVSPDGQVTDLGHCTGMRNDCQSPLRPDVTLFRWYSWSTLNFNSATYKRPGSQIVCSASHFGTNRTDTCRPRFPTSVSTTTTPRPTTTTERPRTGNVTLDAYCSFPGQKRISCHVDSDDPQSTVLWALLTPQGELRSLGNCSGLRGSCRTSAGSNVTLSRWYSWSTVTFPDSADLAGSKLFCSGYHRGEFSLSECSLEDPTAEVNDCIRGRAECNSRGWQRNTGSINGVAVCCPPRADNLGLSMNLRYRDHPCLCPK